MGKYLPLGLKITLCVCLGVLMSCGIVVFADTLSESPCPCTKGPCAKCCVPNARNFGYWETQWRTWPCDQRPEKSFPSALGAEVISTPPGQVQTPLPKATVLPPKSEAPGPNPESPPTPGPQEGMQLPGDQTPLPGDEMHPSNEPTPLPGPEIPAEGPAPKRSEKPGKSTETPTPAPDKAALEGGFPGLQPESPLPPATKETPLAPLPSGGNDQGSPSGPARPAPKKENGGPTLKPESPAVPKAPLPSDSGMLPSQESQVAQISALEPVTESRPNMLARADGTALQPAPPKASNGSRTAAPGVTDVVMDAPVAVAGYCPVELSENEQWVRGDPRWSVVYAGRTFLLSGPEQQQRFLAAAGRYAPAFAGDDAVMSVDNNTHVAGKPEFTIFCGGKAYMFSSAETLARFQQDPHRYMVTGR
jgi:YHS domain-containing protein